MATTYKVLGQGSYAANTPTVIYTVPAATQAVISSITVCNQNATASTFTIAVQPAGTTLATKHYINFGTAVPANDTIALQLGITLAATDVVTCAASTTAISFSVFGSEIS